MEINKNFFAALIHYPVYNKKKEIVATSITTLDLHDIARISRTYGLAQFYVVTPIVSHQELIKRILNHWLKGFGATYNPTRKQAFENMTVLKGLDDTIKSIKNSVGQEPEVIVTAARNLHGSIDYKKMKELINNRNISNPGPPFLLLFGTGWGLTDEIIAMADYILKPIEGGTDYNHLPVRGAFAIIIDRLMGR